MRNLHVIPQNQPLRSVPTVTSPRTPRPPRAAKDFITGGFPAVAVVPPFQRLPYLRLRAPEPTPASIIKLESQLTAIDARQATGNHGSSRRSTIPGASTCEEVIDNFWAVLTNEDEARYAFIHFPTILDIVCHQPKALVKFKTKLQSDLGRTRRGLFLEYVPDLLNCANSGGTRSVGAERPIPDAIMHILRYIITGYPQEVYFAIQTRCELQPAIEDTLLGKQRQHLEDLIPKHQRKLWDKLRLELTKLAEPVTHLVNFVNNAQRIVESSVVYSTREALMKREFNKLKELCCSASAAGIAAGSVKLGAGTSTLGSRGNAFSNAHWLAIETAVNPSRLGSLKNLLSMNTAVRNQAFAALRAIINTENLNASTSTTRSVASYSPWLAAYSGTNIPARDQIQIPGTFPPQYLQNFSPNLRVIRTLRQPKRIAMIGLDGVLYERLYKSGDDLRVDQIIYRTLYLMQLIIRHDPECAGYDLNEVQSALPIVIPFSPTAGLVEWLRAKTLQHALSEVHGFTAVNNNARNIFTNHLAGIDPSRRTAQLAMYTTASVQGASAIDQFRKSYIVMSICLWILGVGDRHLANWMVTPHGDAIPIDFDMYMSRGVMSPVPEIAPMRWTRQIEAPINDDDFKDIGTVVLRALRKSFRPIIKSLAILEWQPPADACPITSNQVVPGAGALTTSNARADMRKRIRDIRAILEDGVTAWAVIDSGLRRRWPPTNPAVATIRNNAYLILKGSNNLRFHEQTRVPTARAQIESLLEMATDPDILVRMFIG
ncbi:hypothetical protein HKX48_001479, partial [Thoreauomyces humboldtii]